MPHHQARRTLDVSAILAEGFEIGLKRVADDMDITVEEVLDRLEKAKAKAANAKAAAKRAADHPSQSSTNTEPPPG